MKFVKLRTSIIFFLLVVVLIVGCSNDQTGSNQTGNNQTGNNHSSSNESGSDQSNDQNAQEQEKFVLDWVTMWPASHADNERAREVFWDPIEEKSEGQIEINLLGGPETMGIGDMVPTAQRGDADIVTVIIGAYESLIPGISAWMNTELLPEEERSSGAYEYMDELHQEVGLKYLGRPQIQEEGAYFTWLRGVKPETIEDFNELVIGAVAPYRVREAEALGANSVSLSIGELYPALEQGVINAIGAYPLEGAVSNGFHELSDYVIDHPFEQSSVVTIMNLDSWNELPTHLQDIITETMLEGELELVKVREGIMSDLKEQLQSDGLEFYKLSPDVADWYHESIQEGFWEGRTSEVSLKLKEMLLK